MVIYDKLDCNREKIGRARVLGHIYVWRAREHLVPRITYSLSIFFYLLFALFFFLLI